MNRGFVFEFRVIHPLPFRDPYKYNERSGTLHKEKEKLKILPWLL